VRASLDEGQIAAFQSLQAYGPFFATLDHTTTVFLVRHGQSEGNVHNTYQGRFDFPLSKKGEAQARQVGEWLRQYQPDSFIASPMLRARRSAEIIAEVTCGVADK